MGEPESDEGVLSPIREKVAITTRRASATISQINEQVYKFRRAWYDRLDPFLYYDHTYKYRLIPELWRLALSAAFFFLSGLLMMFMNGVADYRHPGAFRLPDLGFTLVPEISSRPNLPNEIVGVALLCTGVLILTHPKRLMVFRRLLVIYSIILILRSICVVATSLPDPSSKCVETRPYIHYTQPPPIEEMKRQHSFWRGVQQSLFPFESSTCGDLIFSGHTVSFILCSLIWDRYFTGKRSRWPVYLFHVVSVAGLLSMLSVRFHYTIDILVAIIVTVAVWQRYHIFVDYTQLYEEKNHGDDNGGFIKVLETGEYTHMLPRKKSIEKNTSTEQKVD
jgi:hypothetical protein